MRHETTPNLHAEPWTDADEAEVVRAYNSRVAFDHTAERLGRSKRAIQNKTNELRKLHPELFTRKPTPGIPDTWGNANDDPAHVAAVLAGGGFGALTFKARPQRLFVWRAA